MEIDFEGSSNFGDGIFKALQPPMEWSTKIRPRLRHIRRSHYEPLELDDVIVKLRITNLTTMYCFMEHTLKDLDLEAGIEAAVYQLEISLSDGQRNV